MAGDLYRDDGLTVDFRACRVWVDDEEIQTSAIRFRILSHLIKHAGRPVGPREIMHHAWQGEDYDLGLVRWHVAKLRKELSDSPPRRIVHVRGFGYRFDIATPALPARPRLEPNEDFFRRLVVRPFQRCRSFSTRETGSVKRRRAVRCLR